MMSPPPSLLATVIENWERYQTHLSAAIAPLTSAQLDLRAAPHLQTLGTIAAHIVAARAYWFHSVMGEGDAAFGALRALDEHASFTAAPIVQGLQTTWTLMRERLERWTPAELEAEIFPRQFRGEQYMLSRAWVVWHLLEHDLHHGGEVSLTLGMHGLTAPDI